MKRRMTTTLAVLAFSIGAAVAAPSALAANRCVGPKHGCYPTVQQAVDAAADGDTITIARGTYAGGVTVDVSVAIVGAGAGLTIISGGGPVLTLGVAGAASEPTISLTGVTVTGGVATGDGNVTFVGLGGGIRIPGAADGAGATVTIRSSVITGNRATPSSTVDSGEPCPGGSDCQFAGGFGAGIADIGRLTLIDTTVSNNVAGGGLASEANGAGIWTATNGGAGTLTLINSTVTGNRASVSAPNGRFAGGGGIFVQDGEDFHVINSVISNNATSVTSSFPSGVDTSAVTAGIQIGGFGSATIQGSRITGNVASATNSVGPTSANSAALGESFGFCTCGQTFVLKDTVISGNSSVASGGDGTFSANIVEIDGPATVSTTAIIDNSVSATSSSGAASALGAFFDLNSDPQPVVMKNSIVRGNVAKASTPDGPVAVVGAGIVNGGRLQLHNVAVSGNSGTASGTSGHARGGGIWNGMPLAPDGPTPQLTLDHTLVTHNALSASAGLSVQGGGVFADGFPFTNTSSVIAGNTPDQCVGC